MKTINVDDETYYRLESFRRKNHFRSFDRAIEELLWINTVVALL